MKVSKHAFSQLRTRCGIDITHQELDRLLQSSIVVCQTPNGTYKLTKRGKRFAVFVVNTGTVVTALSVEHAFSNCPVACFYALLRRGQLAPAVKLRLLWGQGMLPPQHGTDPSNYRFDKRAAQKIWRMFNFREKNIGTLHSMLDLA